MQLHVFVCTVYCNLTHSFAFGDISADISAMIELPPLSKDLLTGD